MRGALETGMPCQKLRPEAIALDTWACPPGSSEDQALFGRRDERDGSPDHPLLDEIGIAGPDEMDERSMNVPGVSGQSIHVMPDAGRTAASQCRMALSWM